MNMAENSTAKPTSAEHKVDATTEASSAISATARADTYTDDRKRWDWQSRYPSEARKGITFEAWVLLTLLVVLLAFIGVCLGLSGQSSQLPLGNSPQGQSPGSESSHLVLNVDYRFLTVFLAGCVGGTTFSIKWLIHSAAKGRWHLDRRYWRFLVPLIGGIYACVVLTLSDAGFVAGQAVDKARPIAISAAFAFLVGYFSDGVSGLLSNIANAVFGTLEKK
ncbi:MAG: hypothetical protein Q7T93_08190 [Methylobacterium sp.]|uniref:hypothetical protein n=1 Tax=Methylobacterium sp. TaxID=409 RepID=UPI002720E251|nr:hypothetical protein [Methylobacterium sp.]MDO9426801.1 hypothetical protein [Methylobacterium sp.]